VRESCIVRIPNTLAQLDGGSVVLRAMKRASVTGPQRFSKEFNATVYGVPSKGGKTVLIMKETLWKNHFNFIKFVPITYVNLIVIVITVYEKRKLFSYRPS
jgi:hypothetical protein